MALAVKPIVEDKYSYMIAEIDSKLLKVMKVLGFGTRQIGKSINYLTSETVPVCSSKRGLTWFFSIYGELRKAHIITFLYRNKGKILIILLLLL